MSRLPTEPGWWWRCDHLGRPWCGEVFLHNGKLCWVWGAVTDDGRWIAPVATPEEVDRLRAERDEARAEVERLRSLVAALERAAGGGGGDSTNGGAA